MGACAGEPEDVISSDTWLAYFPLYVGYYQIYDVDEIRYQQGTEPDTLKYELKAQVVDSFQNTTGSTTYVIYRSVRTTADEPWQFRETWSARIDDNRAAIVTEGNTSFVKLLFPAATGLSWNGNRLNNLEDDEYEVLAVNESFAVDTLSFDRTITVEQEFNDDPIVYTDLRTEVYAEGVGLIYKELKQLVICQQQTCNSNEIIEQGVDLKQYIKEYGKVSD